MPGHYLNEYVSLIGTAWNSLIHKQKTFPKSAYAILVHNFKRRIKSKSFRPRSDQ